MNKFCPVCKGKDYKQFLDARESHGNSKSRSTKRFKYFLCESCGSLFHFENINQKFYRKYYKADYYAYSPSKLEKAFSTLSNYMKRLVISRNIQREEIDILDVGCGSGEFLKSLPNSYRKYGVEIDTKAVKDSRNKGIKVFEGDFINVNIKTKFDVIVMWHVIEHIKDPHQFIEKAYLLLKPNGYLFCSTPNVSCLGFKQGNADWYHLDAPRHITLFNNRSLTDLMLAHKFKEVRTMTNYWEFPLDTFWSLKNKVWSLPLILAYPIFKILDRECITATCRKI